jgi:uncharacterized protein YfaS (alpha-2-macroglobulin family)
MSNLKASPLLSPESTTVELHKLIGDINQLNNTNDFSVTSALQKIQNMERNIQQKDMTLEEAYELYKAYKESKSLLALERQLISKAIRITDHLIEENAKKEKLEEANLAKTAAAKEVPPKPAIVTNTPKPTVVTNESKPVTPKQSTSKQSPVVSKPSPSDSKRKRKKGPNSPEQTKSKR